MNILAPSILAADCGRLAEQIALVEQAGAKYLHIDVMDGSFVPALSFGCCVVSSLRKETDMVFDVHLMVSEPVRFVADFARCGADIITVHLEACSDVEDTLQEIHRQGCKAGLSIKPGTPVCQAEPYLHLMDLLLIMTVEPGFGGQPFIPHSMERIREARRMVTRKGIDVDIEVDGGITGENISAVLEAGANVIVAGSSVFRGDVTRNVRILSEYL